MKLSLWSWQAAGMIAIASAAVAYGDDRAKHKKDKDKGAPPVEKRTVPEPERRTSEGQLDPRVDQILTRLEQKHIDSLQTRVRWEQRFLTDPPGQETVKEGE